MSGYVEKTVMAMKAAIRRIGCQPNAAMRKRKLMKKATMAIACAKVAAKNGSFSMIRKGSR